MEKKSVIPTYSRLPREAVAAAMAAMFTVRVVRPPKSTDRGMLAVYQSSGVDAGIYVGNPGTLCGLVRRFVPSATIREANDVLDLLREADEQVVFRE